VKRIRAWSAMPASHVQECHRAPGGPHPFQGDLPGGGHDVGAACPPLATQQLGDLAGGDPLSAAGAFEARKSVISSELRVLVPLAGLEPATCCLGGVCPPPVGLTHRPQYW
jgi:hypothetical protein